MKINTTKLIFGSLKYWLQNGKTMTAIIVGLVTGIIAQVGTDLSPENMDVLKEFIPFFILLLVGFLDKVRKTFGIVAEKEKK